MNCCSHVIKKQAKIQCSTFWFDSRRTAIWAQNSRKYISIAGALSAFPYYEQVKRQLKFGTINRPSSEFQKMLTLISWKARHQHMKCLLVFSSLHILCKFGHEYHESSQFCNKRLCTLLLLFQRLSIYLSYIKIDKRINCTSCSSLVASVKFNRRIRQLGLTKAIFWVSVSMPKDHWMHWPIWDWLARLS